MVGAGTYFDELTANRTGHWLIRIQHGKDMTAAADAHLSFVPLAAQSSCCGVKLRRCAWMRALDYGY